jgi:hypothetical protein
MAAPHIAAPSRKDLQMEPNMLLRGLHGVANRSTMIALSYLSPLITRSFPTNKGRVGRSFDQQPDQILLRR